MLNRVGQSKLCDPIQIFFNEWKEKENTILRGLKRISGTLTGMMRINNLSFTEDLIKGISACVLLKDCG